MAAPINIDTYSDALVLLGTAGIVVPLARRWGLSPVLGFLGAGAALGPLGLSGQALPPCPMTGAGLVSVASQEEPTIA